MGLTHRYRHVLTPGYQNRLQYHTFAKYSRQHQQDILEALSTYCQTHLELIIMGLKTSTETLH